MRDLSPLIQSVLASDSNSVWLAVDITTTDNQVIRACEIDADVTSLNLLGASIDVASTHYPAILKSMPEIKHSRGQAPNGGSLTIFDLDHFLGVLTAQIDQILEGSSIVVTVLFQKSDGTFEADIYFKGVVRDVQATDESTNFNIIADTDTRTHFVAGRALTQRCLAIFGDDRCGKPAFLRVAGETCSNVYDDVMNGCLAKRWQARFWGVPILTTLTGTLTGGGWDPGGGGGIGGGPGGDGGGGPGCPSVTNFALIVDETGMTQTTLVENLRKGMLVQDAIGRRALIEKIEFVDEDEMLYVECENGFASECSSTEPFIRSISDDRGKFARELVVGVDTIFGLDLKTMKAETSVVAKVEAIDSGRVAQITLSNGSASLYVSGVTATEMLCRHNMSMKAMFNTN